MAKILAEKMKINCHWKRKIAIILKFVDFNDEISNTAGTLSIQRKSKAFVVWLFEQNPVVTGDVHSLTNTITTTRSLLNNWSLVLTTKTKSFGEEILLCLWTTFFAKQTPNTKSLLYRLEKLSVLVWLRDSTKDICHKYILKWLVKEINYEKNANYKPSTRQSIFFYI